MCNCGVVKLGLTRKGRARARSWSYKLSIKTGGYLEMLFAFLSLVFSLRVLIRKLNGTQYRSIIGRFRAPKEEKNSAIIDVGDSNRS